MPCPETFLAVAREAVAKHPDSIEAAATLATKNIRKLPEFSQFIDQLVNDQIRSMIWMVRGMNNNAVRREAGEFGGPPKVGLGTGIAEKAAASAKLVYLNYAIDGRSLKNILGSELSEIADREESVANGHLFNVRLCRKLAKAVPSDKAVGQVISESALKRIFNGLQKAA